MDLHWMPVSDSTGGVLTRLVQAMIWVGFDVVVEGKILPFCRMLAKSVVQCADVAVIVLFLCSCYLV